LNADELFSENILRKYNSANVSDEIVRIVTEEDYSSGLITADREKLTYKFSADFVPDFTFATSNNYLWDGSSLIVDQQTVRRAFIDAAYKSASKEFAQVAEIARKSIHSFSNHLPGFPYPYPKMTIFNGQGGMEFPMMVNNSNVKDFTGTVHLTSHEIFHTYFPFYMGINERKYAWMDEGWAVMIPFDFQSETAPGYDPRSNTAKSYSEFAGKDTDIIPMVPSHQLRGPSYRTASYRRSGAAYQILRETLGDSIFKKSLLEFMHSWKGKHPAPYDFFFTFNDVSGQNLNWFWKPWFFENKYPDLEISLTSSVDDKIEITVKNIGGMPVPLKVFANYDDGTKELIINEKADFWKETDKLKKEFSIKKKISKLELGDSTIPDVDTTNNTVQIN
jgi:hypothetical protein